MSTLAIVALVLNVYAILVTLFGRAPFRHVIGLAAFTWAVCFWLASIITAIV